MVSLSSNQVVIFNVHRQNKSNCGEKMLSEQFCETLCTLLVFCCCFLFSPKHFSVKLLGVFYTMNNTAEQKGINLLQHICGLDDLKGLFEAK